MPSAKPLPPRQLEFVIEYLANGLNATKAAITAGYSKRTADSQASRLLKSKPVKAEIARRTKKRLAKREITADRVLDEIAKLAFANPQRFYNPFGSLIPIHELDEDVAASIAGLEILEVAGGRGKKKKSIATLKKIKFADKGVNLERLGRYLKLFGGDRGTPDEPFVVKIESILSGGTK